MTNNILDIDTLEKDILDAHSAQLSPDSVNELANTALSIQNIPLQEWIDKYPVSLLKYDRHSITPSMPGNFTLAFYIGVSAHIPLLFKTNTMMPYIEGAILKVRYDNHNGEFLDSGVIFDQCKDSTYGLTVLAPFNGGKKVYGFYKNTYSGSGLYKQYFMVGAQKEDDVIPNVLIPPTPRDVTSELTENDRIIASNCSPRFKKMSLKWIKLYSAIYELEKLSHRTIDPNYIEKIMWLNHQLSYPQFSNG